MTGIFFSSLPCAINTAAGVACGVVALLCCVAAGWEVLFICTASCTVCFSMEAVACVAAEKPQVA